MGETRHRPTHSTASYKRLLDALEHALVRVTTRAFETVPEAHLGPTLALAELTQQLADAGGSAAFDAQWDDQILDLAVLAARFAGSRPDPIMRVIGRNIAAVLRPYRIV